MKHVLQVLPVRIAGRLKKESLLDVQEIRLRIGAPAVFRKNGVSWYWKESGEISVYPQGSYTVTRDDCVEVINRATQFSLYSYRDCLSEGYLTAEGGVRIGICGEMVRFEGSRDVRAIRSVSSVCIRLPRQIFQAADEVRKYATDDGARSTLIVSPPGMGKTTMLRELIRILSEKGYNVGVADERGEIGACSRGIPFFRVGPNTDFMEGADKTRMLSMMLRAMSPQVLATDEIGSAEDAEILKKAAFSGVKILATAHGSIWEDLQSNAATADLTEAGVFERFVFLSSKQIGALVCVTDGKRRILWQRAEHI